MYGILFCVKRVAGLGFIDAFCLPHHDATQSNGLARSQDSDAMLLEQHQEDQHHQQVCIGIDESAALVVKDGMVSVVSGDGVANCCVKTVDRSDGSGSGQRIRTRVISQDHESVALESLLRNT
jgi:hypothetical protein